MQNLEGRQRLAIVALRIWLFGSFLGAVSGAMYIVVLSGTGTIWSPAAGRFVDQTAMATGLVYLAALVFAAVCVGRWIHRASANAHAVSDTMSISLGWSVGWYFVPFANLVKPFQAMREIWQVSIAPGDPASVPVPSLLRWWWGLWLLSNILGNISFRLAGTGAGIGQVIASSWVDIVTFGVDAALTVALIRIIRQLTANQRSMVDASVFE